MVIRVGGRQEKIPNEVVKDRGAMYNRHSCSYN